MNHAYVPGFTHLHTHYQPILDLKRRTVYAHESLARWDVPVTGMVSAAHLVGLMRELGVLGNFNRHLWRLSMAFAPGKVSINATPRDLRHQLTDLMNCASDAGLAPSQLIVELPEPPANPMEVAHLRSAITTLNQSGVQVWMCEAGLDARSLEDVAALGVAGLKIDCRHSREHWERAIAPAIAQLHRLGLVAIAEKVESEHEFKKVVDVDFNYAQGYFLGSPAPPQPKARGVLQEGGRG